MMVRDFCLLVGQEMRITRVEVEEVFRVMMEVSQRLLAEGDEIRLPGIGKLFCEIQKPRRHLDRFKLAQGIEVFRELPERRKVRLEGEKPEVGVRFRGYRQFEHVMNNQPRPPSIK